MNALARTRREVFHCGRRFRRTDEARPARWDQARSGPHRTYGATGPTMHRRPLLPLLATPLLPRPARAQGEAWPSRPVRIVVVFPPGGSSDIVARVLAEQFSQRLGQRFLVDNRPGAGGILGADVVAKA